MTTNNNNLTKIGISSTGNKLSSKIDHRFGRCKYFLIVNINGEKIVDFQAVKNNGAAQDSGAGVKAVEQISELGISTLITGEPGPKVVDPLNQLGVKAYHASGTAQDAIEQFAKGELAEINNKELTGQNPTSQTQNKNEKIYFPLLNDQGENSNVSPHFGHAPYFGFYNTVTKELKITKNTLDHHDQLQSPVDQIMQTTNPTMIYSQGIGKRAIDLFSEKGVAIKTGPYQTIKDVVNNLDKLNELTKDCGH